MARGSPISGEFIRTMASDRLHICQIAGFVQQNAPRAWLELSITRLVATPAVVKLHQRLVQVSRQNTILEATQGGWFARWAAAGDGEAAWDGALRPVRGNDGQRSQRETPARRTRLLVCCAQENENTDFNRLEGCQRNGGPADVGPLNCGTPADRRENWRLARACKLGTDRQTAACRTLLLKPPGSIDIERHLSFTRGPGWRRARGNR